MEKLITDLYQNDIDIENIKCIVSDLQNVVNTHYPDIRKIINTIQVNLRL